MDTKYSNMLNATVGRINGIENKLDCSIYTTNFTSLRQITQIFCELNNIQMTELGNTSVSDIVGWAHKFFEQIRKSPVNKNQEEFVPIKPLTLPLLIELEDAIGTPFYGGIDLDRISTQLICVEKCYGLDSYQMSSIRNMQYNEYIKYIWEPLKTALIEALTPKIDVSEDTTEKNQ